MKVADRSSASVVIGCSRSFSASCRPIIIMDYASQAERIDDDIRQYKDVPIEQFSDAVAESQQQADAAWKEKVDEYSHKHSALAEGGGEEIAGALGIAGAYALQQTHGRPEVLDYERELV